MDQPTRQPFDPDRIEVTTLHVDSHCPDSKICDRITDIGHPDYLHLVATPETDPRIIAAHAEHIGPGEILLRWKRRTGMPGVPPA